MGKKYISLAISLLFMPVMSWAIMPVIDIKSFYGILKNVHEISDLKRMAHDDMQKLRHSFDQLNPLRLKEDSLSKRTWSSKTWQDAMTKGADLSVHGLTQQFREKNSDLYSAAKKSSVEDLVRREADTDSLLSSTATREYNQLDAKIKAINVLSNKIVSANSMKASLDLNNRLLVELSYIQIEVLRMALMKNQAESIALHHRLRSVVTESTFLGGTRRVGK